MESGLLSLMQESFLSEWSVSMSKELTDAKRRAIQKYDAVHTKQYHLKLNTGTDAEIIEHLSKLKNVQGYIKELIKKDLGIS